VPVLERLPAASSPARPSLDLVLPRIMTGERLRVEDIAALAAGGNRSAGDSRTGSRL